MGSVVIVVPKQAPSQSSNGLRRVCCLVGLWGWSISVLFLVVGLLAGRYLIPRVPGPDPVKAKGIEAERTKFAKLTSEHANLTKEHAELRTERDLLKAKPDTPSGGSQPTTSRLQLDATKKDLQQAHEDLKQATADKDALSASLADATAEKESLASILAEAQASLATKESQLLKAQRLLSLARTHGVIQEGQQSFQVHNVVKVKGSDTPRMIGAVNTRTRDSGFGQQFIYKLRTDRPEDPWRTSEDLVLVSQ